MAKRAMKVSLGCLEIDLQTTVHVVGYFSLKYSKTCEKWSPKRKTMHGLIDKSPLFGGFFVLFKQGRVTEMWPLYLQCGLYYSEWHLTNV